MRASSATMAPNVGLAMDLERASDVRASDESTRRSLDLRMRPGGIEPPRSLAGNSSSGNMQGGRSDQSESTTQGKDHDAKASSNRSNSRTLRQSTWERFDLGFEERSQRYEKTISELQEKVRAFVGLSQLPPPPGLSLPLFSDVDISLNNSLSKHLDEGVGVSVLESSSCDGNLEIPVSSSVLPPFSFHSVPDGGVETDGNRRETDRPLTYRAVKRNTCGPATPKSLEELEAVVARSNAEVAREQAKVDAIETRILLRKTRQERREHKKRSRRSRSSSPEPESDSKRFESELLPSPHSCCLSRPSMSGWSSDRSLKRRTPGTTKDVVISRGHQAHRRPRCEEDNRVKDRGPPVPLYRGRTGDFTHIPISQRDPVIFRIRDIELEVVQNWNGTSEGITLKIRALGRGLTPASHGETPFHAGEAVHARPSCRC